MPSFGKGGGSRNSHEMRLYGMYGMVSLYLLVFEPILLIKGSGGVQFPCTLAFFGSLWPMIPPLFGVGFNDTGFHDAHMIYVD